MQGINLSKNDYFTIGGYAALVFSVASEFTDKLTGSFIGIVVFAIGIILLSISYLNQSRRTKYETRLIRRKTEGNEAIPLLNEVRSSIQVTHTLPIVPSDEYTNLMLGKLQAGVKVSRVVTPKALENPKVAEWLSKFDKYKIDGSYIEYRETNYDLPFSFSIYDNHKVLMYFPSYAARDDQDEIMQFQNKKVAKNFRILFNKLIWNKNLAA